MRKIDRFGDLLFGGGIFFALAASFLLAGCSLGFARLGPNDDASKYKKFLGDLNDLHGDDHWAWVRGYAIGDFTGDGQVDEAIVVTFQAGTFRSPGTIRAAYLLILAKEKDDSTRLLAKTELFVGSPFLGSPRPENEIDWIDDVPLTRVRAQTIPDKVSTKEDICVYFWGESLPGSVWYAGFSVDKNGSLEKTFETSLRQRTPGFLVLNLDKSSENARRGYQLAFDEMALPEDLAARFGSRREAPTWGHIFARGDGADDRVYRQADRLFASYFTEILACWNHAYIKATFEGFPAGDMAWIEYRTGILHFYNGDSDLAVKLLERGERGAADTRLAGAIRKVREHIVQMEKGSAGAKLAEAAQNDKE
ncbi:MAG: hypothetical protein LBE84_12135 [Planctomycetota bacterium]|nr:hypothetical protein [Planctomycetota bacterium]